jgi:hypothetical protein
MANSYSAPNFNVDTSTNVAGLTALKGSAPASTDILYIAESAKVTFESDCSLLKTYQGDNSAGTAAIKKGDIDVNSGVTLTIYDTTLSGGWTGEGALNVTNIYGTVTGNTTAKINNSSQMTSNFNVIGGTLNGWHVGCYGANANNVFDGASFYHCTYGLYFAAVASGYVAPAMIRNCTFTGCITAAILTTSNAAGTCVDLIELLAQGNNLFVGDGTGLSQVCMGFGSISRYYYGATSALPIKRIKPGIGRSRRWL